MDRKRKKYSLILTAIFLSLLVIGCGEIEEVPAAMALVKTQQVLSKEDTNASAYSGEVRARYESQLSFQVGGKVIRRNVELGSRVKAGDVLMEIDTKDIVESVKDSAAQVESFKAQLKLAEANMNRYKQLYAMEAVSAIQYEQYRMDYEATLAACKQAEAKYVQAQNLFEYSRLVADHDGVISDIRAEAGQIISSGQNIITLVRIGEVEVEINIPENRLSDMTIDTPVLVSFWALKNIVIDGTIREISPMADVMTRTYKARIRLIDPPPTVHLGMTAGVSLQNKMKSGDEISIPLSAIYQTGNQPQVWVVKDKIVNLRSVDLEYYGNNEIHVISGLSNGETIVVAGVHKLKEGQEIRLMEDGDR